MWGVRVKGLLSTAFFLLYVIKTVRCQEEMCSMVIRDPVGNKLRYNQFHFDNFEESMFAFISTNFGVGVEMFDILNQLQTQMRTDQCTGFDKSRSDCDINRFKRLAFNVHQDFMGSTQTMFEFFDCELNNEIRFYAKAAAWCTYFGLYDYHRNCAAFLFLEAMKIGNRSTKSSLNDIELESHKIFRAAYRLDWASLTNRNYSHSLFMMPHELERDSSIYFQKLYPAWRSESEKYFRQCQNEYLSLLFSGIEIGLVETGVNQSWVTDLSNSLARMQTVLRKASQFAADPSEMEWIDLKLCAQVMVNVRVNFASYPVPALNSSLKSIFGMHTAEEGDQFICQGSMHAGNGYWVPRFRDKPWAHQHLQSLTPSSSMSPKLRLYVSIYDWFAFVNIAHICNSGELFWSTVAAAKMHAMLSENLSGIVLFALSPPARNRMIRKSVELFFKLYFRTIVRYCLSIGLTVYVEDLLFLGLVVNDGFLVPVFGPLTVGIRALTHEEVFPVLLEKPVNNVLTPEGAQLMQRQMWQECATSSEISAQRRYFLNSRVNEENVSMDALFQQYMESQRQRPLVVLATRTGPRHLENSDEIVFALRWFFEYNLENISTAPLEVIAINFGELNPCGQLDVMSRTVFFAFIHGAEGALVSFLPSNSVVVEIHPAGCCVHDFESPENYKYYYQPDAHATNSPYYFFSGTIASSWLCVTWLKHMMGSPYCGTVVNIEEFIETLKYIYMLP